MKREDFEDEEEEERLARRRPASKRKKKKMTVAELRESYTEKIRSVYPLYERNVFLIVWRTLIADSNWTFKDALNFISDSIATCEERYIAIAVAMNDFIAHDDLPWKHWFFMEFPDIVRDLKMTWDDPDIPYPWLRESWNRVRNNPEFQHKDDPLFLDVIWRSVYMWTAMFRRRCAKYYAEFYLRYRQRMRPREARIRAYDDPEEMRDFGAMRDSVMLHDTSDGIMTVKYVDAWGGKSVLHDVDDDFVKSCKARIEGHHLRKKYGIVARAWMMWQFVGLEATKIQDPDFFNELGKRVIRVQPNVGEDRAHVMADEFEYNFGPEHVEAFMRQYMERMSDVGSIPPILDDDWESDDDVDEDWVRLLYDVKTRIYPFEDLVYHVLETSLTLGFAVIKTLNNNKGLMEVDWPTMNKLPMCPRRIKKTDPEKRAIQFLGERNLEK